MVSRSTRSISVFLRSGSNAIKSRIRRKPCLRPERGGQIQFHLVAEHSQTDAVIIADGAESEERGGFNRVTALGFIAAAECPGSGNIDQQHDVEFAFFNVFLDIGGTHAGGNVPVNIADIVFIRVFADFVKFDPAPLENAVVGAADDFIDRPAGCGFRFFLLAQLIQMTT